MTHVVRHSDPEAFLAAAAPVLARSAASAAAFRAWVGGLQAEPRPQDGSPYLATYADGASFGAALARPDGPLVFEDSDPAAARAFANDLAAERPQLSCVVGRRDACEAFAAAWHERTGRAAVLRYTLRHHMLTHVQSVAAADGAARVATPGDLDWLVESQYAFMREAGVPDNPERMRAAIPGRITQGRFWIWDDGRAVAYAGWSPAGPNAARIAPVYTLPAKRRRGYATALVAARARALLAAGNERLFLLTDLANPTSNAIYARIGFVPGPDVAHFDFVDAAPPRAADATRAP
jgi:predicted GNAT family acetyltransferase